jgi:DNA gyrase/topoisomerase IV subunit A
MNVQALIKNPSLSVEGLMKHLPAPDFPTGGRLLDVDGLSSAYRSGKGAFTLRAKIHYENVSSAMSGGEEGGAASAPVEKEREKGGRLKGAKGGRRGGSKGGRPSLVITELPYQVR